MTADVQRRDWGRRSIGEAMALHVLSCFFAHKVALTNRGPPYSIHVSFSLPPTLLHIFLWLLTRSSWILLCKYPPHSSPSIFCRTLNSLTLRLFNVLQQDQPRGSSHRMPRQWLGLRTGSLGTVLAEGGLVHAAALQTLPEETSIAYGMKPHCLN